MHRSWPVERTTKGIPSAFLMPTLRISRIADRDIARLECVKADVHYRQLSPESGM